MGRANVLVLPLLEIDVTIPMNTKVTFAKKTIGFWGGSALTSFVVLAFFALAMASTHMIGDITGLKILTGMMCVPFVLSLPALWLGYCTLKNGTGGQPFSQQFLLWISIVAAALALFFAVSIWLMILEAVLS